MNVKVGDTVIVKWPVFYGDKNEQSAHPVTRVGRKYFYVRGQYGSREVGFDLVTGWEQRSANSVGASAQAFTPDGFAEHERRTAAVHAVTAAVRGYSWTSDLTTDQLERIVAVFNESTP